MRRSFERRITVASEGDGVGTPAAGVFDGGDGEGSASASGDAQDDIVLAGFAFFHFGDSGSGVVFAGLGGISEGVRASGHDELDGARIGVEGWGNLTGVEGAKTAAGSSAYVDETATVTD